MTFLQYFHQKNMKEDETCAFDLGEKFKVEVKWLSQAEDGGKNNLYVILQNKLKPEEICVWAKFIRMDVPSGVRPMVVKVGEGYVYPKLNQRRSDDKFVYQPEMPTEEDVTGWFVWPF